MKSRLPARRRRRCRRPSPRRCPRLRKATRLPPLLLHAAVSTIKSGPPGQGRPACLCCAYFEVELPLLPEPELLPELEPMPLLLGDVVDEPLLLGVLDEPLLLGL